MNESESKKQMMRELGFAEESLRMNNTVLCCTDIPRGYTGELQAAYNPDSGVHYVWHTPDTALGSIARTVVLKGSREEAGEALRRYPLAGWWAEGVPQFVEMTGDGPVHLETREYSAESLYSRNGDPATGEALARKRVVIAGCGSVGSQVAMHLARAGVKRFVLVDADCMELHNLSRTFDRSMLGQFKTKAVAQSLQLISAQIVVDTFESDVQNVETSFYDLLVPGETLIIGCADNRVCDEWLCRLAAQLRLDFMSAGFWPNAAVTENFVYRCGTEDHTYGCLLREAIIEDARAQHAANYVDAGSTARPNAGLGCNVQLGNSISAILALDMLMRGEAGYHAQLLPSLSSQMLLFACTTNPALAGAEVGGWAPRPLWSQCCGLAPEEACACPGHDARPDTPRMTSL